jgi:hypothetical protein
MIAAMACWAETGVLGFEEADSEDVDPDITFSWQRGAHGNCATFGSGPGVAHAGPVGPGSFVHFDAGRNWSRDGSAGNSLYFAALHELGHVLGLGHSDAEGALLRPDPDRTRAELSPSEFAGIYSLYGGGTEADGDLSVIEAETSDRKDARVLLKLRQIAPQGLSEFAVFDSDGDGDDELLVWRTDPAGGGALMIYHFGPGPVLERTSGPLYGSSAPGARNLLLVSDSQERLLLCVFPDRITRVNVFDKNGQPTPRSSVEDLRWKSLPLIREGALTPEIGLDQGARRVGNMDGEGRMEEVVRQP